MHPVNLDKHLEELVLGHLSEAERAGLEEHLATCAECARRRDELEALCAELALALPPAPPHPSLRTRVVRAGEELRSPPGSVHAIARILGDEPCLCAIINDGGFEVVSRASPRLPQSSRRSRSVAARVRPCQGRMRSS